MRSLTEYRRPRPHYGREAVTRSPWHALGGWYQNEDGKWVRVWKKYGHGVRSARRAVISTQGGWWIWRVEQFDLRTRAVRTVCARGVNGYLYPQYAWGFAELAALTAD